MSRGFKSTHHWDKHISDTERPTNLLVRLLLGGPALRRLRLAIEEHPVPAHVLHVLLVRVVELHTLRYCLCDHLWYKNKHSANNNGLLKQHYVVVVFFSLKLFGAHVEWHQDHLPPCPDKTGMLLSDGARQATKVISSYTRPAGGAVSMAGVSFSPLLLKSQWI